MFNGNRTRNVTVDIGDRYGFMTLVYLVFWFTCFSEVGVNMCVNVQCSSSDGGKPRVGD